MGEDGEVFMNMLCNNTYVTKNKKIRELFC